MCCLELVAKVELFVGSGAVVISQVVLHFGAELEDERADRAVRDGHGGSSVVVV